MKLRMHPKVVMSSNFFKAEPYNILLYRAEGAAIPLVQKEKTRAAAGGPKDFSWIREGISWTGSYSLVLEKVIKMEPKFMISLHYIRRMRKQNRDNIFSSI